MADSAQYGNYYWGVKVTEDVSSSGEIYIHADDVQVTPAGALEFTRSSYEKEVNRVNLVLPAGKWLAVFAASLMDGRPVAAEHWDDDDDDFDDTPPKKPRTLFPVGKRPTE